MQQAMAARFGFQLPLDDFPPTWTEYKGVFLASVKGGPAHAYWTRILSYINIRKKEHKVNEAPVSGT